MHTTIEQLLAVRDREPVPADINQHLNVCQLCRETLDELVLTRDELNRLPVTEPPRDYWPDILARAEQRRQSDRQRQRRFRYSAFGLAASALLAAVLFFQSGIEQNSNTGQSKASTAVTGNDTVANNATGRNGKAQTAQSGTKTGLDTLISRSAQLEAVLHKLPKRPGIVKASTADLISGLQDSVALIDYQLNLNANKLSTDQSRQLWQQRVDLMNSLVNVRYAESQRVAYSPN